MSEPRHIKCVVVGMPVIQFTSGDGAVGKTCLLVAYAKNQFPEDHLPTVFDSYIANVIHEDQTVQLGLWDTAGQEEFDRLRPLSYPGANIFIICYSVIEQSSLENVTSKWQPEIQKHCPDAKILLVGCKSDLASVDSFKDRIVPFDRAQAVGKQIKAQETMLCSAKTQDGVQEVFNRVISIVLDTSKSSSSKCEI